MNRLARGENPSGGAWPAPRGVGHMVDAQPAPVTPRPRPVPSESPSPHLAAIEDPYGGTADMDVQSNDEEDNEASSSSAPSWFAAPSSASTSAATPPPASASAAQSSPSRPPLRRMFALETLSSESDRACATLL
eukprot:9488406-Pyramimonas_sp.AAC.2